MTVYLKMFMGSLAALTLLVLVIASGAAADQPVATNDITQLRINEFMAQNSRTLADPQEPGTYPDWVEIYNPGATSVSLDGLYLTNDELNPTRFPITVGLTVPAGGFVIFYTDNDPRQGPYHTNFTLSASRGGYIGIYQGTTVINERRFGPQAADISEGYETDGAGNWRSFNQPSPGLSNLRLPPIITRVFHTPTIPLSSAPMLITAVITDDVPGVAATLYYSSSGMTSFTTLPMAASVNQTNTYIAQIPPLPDNTLVYYYVSAQDAQSANDGRSFTSPSLAPVNLYNYVIGYQAPALHVNEVMPDNKSTLPNPDRPGRFDDWIEIYNAGSTPVSLEGLYLIDDPKKAKSLWYRIPIGSGLTIQPGGYMIFYADDREELGPLHVNFGLNENGDGAFLYGGPQGVVLISGFTFRAQQPDRSYGRTPDGGIDLTSELCSTPRAANQLCDNHGYMPYLAR